MTSAFQQAQAEGLCLRYPENLGMHRDVTYEAAANMLLRAINMAQTVPFSWGFIDKPPEGQLVLLFLPPQSAFPNDGIRWQEQEVKYTIPIGQRELEMQETRCGFIPGSQDVNAWRCRRRYRLSKGGHPQLVLVHYTAGPQAAIIPSLMNQPVRAYPLRMVSEPSVFVAGEKAGQKVYPPPGPSMHPGPSVNPPGIPPQPGMPMDFSQQQAMVAQQNANMARLEQRRREQEPVRNRSGSVGTRPPRPEDEDSGDETDLLSVRTLATNRYKRNHELMNDVFRRAAFGNKQTQPPPKPYHIFHKQELEAKTAKLQAEIETLQLARDQRKAAKATTDLDTVIEHHDVSMDVSGDVIQVS